MVTVMKLSTYHAVGFVLGDPLHFLIYLIIFIELFTYIWHPIVNGVGCFLLFVFCF